MRQTEEIKAMIRGMMAQEMESFKETVSNGEADETASPVVYTMLQVLLAKIEAMPKVWHKATAERPETKKDVKLLGWFDTGSTAYDFDIIKFRVRDGEFCDRNGHPLMTDKLWWRTLEKPTKED